MLALTSIDRVTWRQSLNVFELPFPCLPKEHRRNHTRELL